MGGSRYRWGVYDDEEQRNVFGLFPGVLLRFGMTNSTAISLRHARDYNLSPIASKSRVVYRGIKKAEMRAMITTTSVAINVW